MLKNVSRRIASGLLAFALIVTNVILPAMPAFALSNDNTNEVPYWCGTSGVKFGTTSGTIAPITATISTVSGKKVLANATATSGYEITKIIVNGGSKDAVYTPPFTFALKAPINNGGQQADISHVIVCYKETPLLATAMVSTEPATCGLGEKLVYGVISNATFSGTANGTTGAASYSVTATAGTNALFSDNNTTKTFNGQLAGPLTGGQCQEQPKDDHETRPVTGTPVCLPIGQGTVSGYTEERMRSYTLINNVWTPGEWSAWTKVADSDKSRPATLEECPLVKVKPGTPQFADLCGKSNDSYVLPTTDYINYGAVKNGSAVMVTATPDQGYALDLTNTMGWTLKQNGTATYTYEFTNSKCDKVTICHRTNSVTNPYRMITVSVNAVDGVEGNSGNRADHFDEHEGPVATSEAFAQSLKDKKQKWGDIIPPIDGIHDGLNWTAGQAIYENDCKYIGEATPTAPTAVDFCYTDKDYVMVPSVEGITYRIGEQSVNGNYIPYVGEDITITATANKGYTIDSEAQTSWTFTEENFTNEQCLTITKTAKTTTDTNKDGKISIGDTITWEITVTNTSDENLNQVFYVEVEDENTVLENNGYIGYLGAGDSETLTATSTITLEQAAVCKAVNTATFYGRRASQEVYSVERFNMLTDEGELPLATDSATDDYTWECAPGQGGETPETPETPATPVTPAVNTPMALPNTSGSMTPVVVAGATTLAILMLVAASAVKSRFAL